MKLTPLVFLLVPLLLSLACSKRVRVKYDSTVTATEQGYLEADLDKLAALSVPSNPNSDEAQVMGLGSFSAGSFGGWLSERTQYIVGENFSTTSSVSVLAKGIGYVPQLYNEVGFAALGNALGMTLSPVQDSSSSVQTVMTNIGAAVYLDGKQKSVLYEMRVANETITVNTPRVGVDQIGPGLFTAKSLPDSPLDSLANSCLRLSTVFHEAGHTNGNGTNAGFPHAQCTSGTYSGYYACENNLNGPYVIGRIFLVQCYYACQQAGCPPNELDELAAFIADLDTRLTPDAHYSDPTSEREAN